ncbi:MAG: efflux RND transporter periplasmic adaptor subunit [Steroidobacteraceae bacterium]
MNRSGKFVCMLLACLLAACGGRDEPASGQRGPHGGRLLQDADLQLELAIFEDRVPPEFRLYGRAGGRPIPPAELSATVELRRITGIAGGRTDRHEFAPRGDYLVSDAEVYEPHSFDVAVRAQYAGRSHEWRYESPEGRITLPAAVALDSGIATREAGPGVIADQLRLYGRIVPDAERTRAVRARFPGPVRSVNARVGEPVKAGQTLATVESNESLQVYAVTAPMSGTITARNVNVGENTGDAPLFEIVDDAAVWAELAVFARDRPRLMPGQAVEVHAADSSQEAAGKIHVLTPAGGGAGSITARVVLDNRARQWTPGQFVEARVALAEHAAALVVPVSALQRLRDWDVVFVQEGGQYQALPVVTGRRDSSRVEILSGLQPGALVVAENSFLVKADIEKSGASHDH